MGEVFVIDMMNILTLRKLVLELGYKAIITDADSRYFEYSL